MAESKKKRTGAQRARAKIVDYQEVFRGPAGELVLHDLMRQHHVMNSSFDPNPYEMARKEGERNVILRILTILKTDMKALERKIKEANDAVEMD